MAFSGNDYLYLDLDYLTGISEGDAGFMMEVIAMYLDQVPPDLRQIHDLAHQGNRVELRSAIHKIKSSFSNLGIREMRQIAQDIENTLAEEPDWKEIVQQLNQLNIMNEVVIKELKTELAYLENL